MTDAAAGTAPAWSSTRRVLLHGGSVYAPSAPFATAMLVEGDTVAWVGEDAGAHVHRDSADVVIDLQGALVTPGFVDAHVHATSTGLALTGLDLSRATSLADALDRIAAAHAALADGDVLLGHGWDETTWPEGTPPSRADIDRVTGGARAVYISRVDVHSAIVSTAMVDAVVGVRDADGFDSGVVDGGSPLVREAHHRVRAHALGSISAAQRERAQRTMRAHAASLGIVAVHEMAGPAISSPDDLAGLLALAADEPGPLVTGYWGELARDGGIETAQRLGAIGVGGDLFVDGSIGSHTACLHAAYADMTDTGPDATGAAYLDADAIATHVAAAIEAGLQPGFHVIGDRACSAVTEGIAAVAARLGAAAVRAGGVRIEHAEMLSAADIAVLADLGVTASMQPVFDELWGAAGGMYEQRLGSERATRMNRLADLTAAGVLVAFGSDAPVTDLGPWAAIRAAMFHHQPAQRLTARAAFGAHTRAGWRAVGASGVGVLAPGAPAHYAVWDAREAVVQTPDPRIASWSTDERSGTPGLPRIAPDEPLPQALRTVVAGTTVFEDGTLVELHG